MELVRAVDRKLELLAIKNLYRSAHRAYWDGRPRNKAVIMTLLAEATGQTLRLAIGEPDERPISALVALLVRGRSGSSDPDHVHSLPALLAATRAVVSGAEISWTDVSRFLTMAGGALETIFAEALHEAFDDVGPAWLVRDGPTRAALEEAERAYRRGFLKEALVTSGACLESLRDRWSDLAAFPLPSGSHFWRRPTSRLADLVFGDRDAESLLDELAQEDLDLVLTEREEITYAKMGMSVDDVRCLRRVLPYVRRLAFLEGDHDRPFEPDLSWRTAQRKRDADAEFLIERTGRLAFDLETTYPALIRE